MDGATSRCLLDDLNLQCVLHMCNGQAMERIILPPQPCNQCSGNVMDCYGSKSYFLLKFQCCETPVPELGAEGLLHGGEGVVAMILTIEGAVVVDIKLNLILLVNAGP